MSLGVRISPTVRLVLFLLGCTPAGKFSDATKVEDVSDILSKMEPGRSLVIVGREFERIDDQGIAAGLDRTGWIELPLPEQTWRHFAGLNPGMREKSTAAHVFSANVEKARTYVQLWQEVMTFNPNYPAAIQFVVEPDEVVYVGSIHYRLLPDRLQFRVEDRSEAARRFVAEHFPGYERRMNVGLARYVDLDEAIDIETRAQFERAPVAEVDPARIEKHRERVEGLPQRRTGSSIVPGDGEMRDLD